MYLRDFFVIQIDDSKIQEYFPTEHVLTEMMSLYQEIFGLEFKEYDVYERIDWQDQI